MSEQLQGRDDNKRFQCGKIITIDFHSIRSIKHYKTNNKNRSTGPVLIWPNIIIVVDVVFQEILALARVRHIISSSRVIVKTNM